MIESIFLASPSLEERSHLLRVSGDPEKTRGLEAALTKYLARLSVRCTPFGTFAGNSLGTFDRHTRLQVSGLREAKRMTRLDMDYLSELVAGLACEPEVRNSISYVPNSSLVEVAGSFRYAEARFREGKRNYFLVDVEPSEPLRRILAAAKSGASLAQLAESLVDDDISSEDAGEFLVQLVEAQILVPELGPLVTGDNPLEDLVRRLKNLPVELPTVRQLDLVRDTLQAFDERGLGVSSQEYRNLAHSLEGVLAPDLSKLFQVDLGRPSRALTITPRLADELLQGTQVMLDLFAPGRHDPLKEFVAAFEERYGDRRVPLVEVLDEDFGIGFEVSHGPGVDPSPLLAGIPWNSPEADERVVFGARARYIQWKIAETIAAGREEWVIDREEAAKFHSPKNPTMAEAFHVMATILTPAEADQDGTVRPESGKPLAVLESAMGPSGARLLGRFCRNGTTLCEAVRAHLREEESLHPEVIYFELVHLPEGRVGNILARPVLRDFELAYVGASGATKDRILSLEDLTVELDSGNVVLRSRTWGREVRPRLTSAHNTAWKSLAVYKFLAALQSEGCVEGVTWLWGPLSGQPRLPRVRWGNLILARQQWNASRAETERLRAGRGFAAFREAEIWRGERNLPRFVGLVDSDNVLPIDWHNPLSVESFLDEIRGREGFALQEIFSGERSDIVESDEGRLMNEVLIPYVRKTPLPRSGRVVNNSRAAGLRPDSRATRVPSFSPGSEWLTAKIYGGPAALDRFLAEDFAPHLQEWVAAGILRSWFFIRYGDPHWHLRLRLRAEPSVVASTLFPQMYAMVQPAIAASRVHKLQYDPYVRELARYGGPEAIESCEEYFRADSDAALSFITMATGDEGLEARWHFTFAGMDRIFEDLGFPVAQRREVAGRLARGFGEEFRVDSPARKHMMERFRASRNALDDLLKRAPSTDPLVNAGNALLEERSRRTQLCTAHLRSLQERGLLETPLEEIAASLLHMFANRALRSSQRAQEMVLYHYLESSYAARVSRGAA